MTSRGSSIVLQMLIGCLVMVNVCADDALAEADVACKADLQSEMGKFLSSGEILNDNQVFALLSQCGDESALGALLEALARPGRGREPIEIASAVEAALRAPSLINDPAATQSIVHHLELVQSPAARASLSYLLGFRDAANALNRILSDDPAPEVRAAAAVSLRNCKTPPEFAGLWRAARLDPERQVRAQAYQTLDRLGQLGTTDDFLAASRAQTDAAGTGRFIGSWLRAGKLPEGEIAETLTRLAENTGSIEASGALFEIFTVLQSPRESLVAMVAAPAEPPTPVWPSSGVPMAPIKSRTIPIEKPHENELQRALNLRRERISGAALAQFAASKDMQEDAARDAIDCALAINRCDRIGCERLSDILRTTDGMSSPLALEASHDIATKVGTSYFTRRHHQYALAFSVAFLTAVALLIGGYVRRHRRVFAIGAGWLLILVADAALQFSSGPEIGVSVWPPLGLWPATALGSVSVTLLVTVAAALMSGRKWLVPAALILGELGWWIVPGMFAVSGVTLKMQHYSRDEDWLPFMLAVFMIIGGPLLTPR